MRKIYSHDELSVKAAAWVHARTTQGGLQSGFEVFLAPKYIADFAALGWWGAQYCEAWGIYGVDHYPSVRSLLFVVESKATRSDFISTFGGSDYHANRKKPIGSLHWVAANREICDPSEVPDFWGLLEPRGSGMREIKQAVYHETTQEIVNHCAYILLWKRRNGRLDEVIRHLVKDAQRQVRRRPRRQFEA